ncbi:MAG: cytochrome b5 domain-containing protein [Candidatus Planktophila sp.]
MESLLYSINGLPVHALIVHFAVVILPLAATALIALIYMPKLKGQYSFITTVGIVLGSAAVLVAKQSGEALAEKIGTPVKHSNYATLLTATSFVLMVLTLIWYRSTKGRRSRVVTPIGHATVIAAIAVLGLTFLTGHTGAQAVWQGKLPEATASAAASSKATPKATATSKVAGTYSASDLKKHASAASCWSAINGNVYDLTKWINRHPGGPSVIKALCGIDGSSMFNGQHGGQSRPVSTLASYKIGKFA